MTFQTMPPSIATYFRDVREVTRPATADKPTLQSTVEDLEREQMIAALKKCGWVQSRAARMLGITPRQVGYKMKKYKIATRPSLL
jgi:Nif-specific regulatory protein